MYIYPIYKYTYIYILCIYTYIYIHVCIYIYTYLCHIYHKFIYLYIFIILFVCYLCIPTCVLFSVSYHLQHHIYISAFYNSKADYILSNVISFTLILIFPKFIIISF